MKLILVRHGNTFGPDDKVVWVGARSDLDLVEKGRAQAKEVGETMKAATIRPDCVVCGPLKRTRQTASIMAETAGWLDLEPQVNDALCEIDYGAWEGRSNDDIRKAHGDRDIDGWQKSSLWPEGYGWTPSPEAILNGWNAMIASIEEQHGPDATAVIVTSNGILRMAAPTYGIKAEEAKVGTGHICVIENGTVALWNTRSLV
ncbi:phosphoglycerate mutase family protein [Cohaesibacter sp. CAU 1516]|uniref:histidine phosphatase family protein n=1 Tax=Cohaesibacter sp. CAU 1516 TaxID=2576038 RepID=UPI0010FDDD19|nr:phosphoglycerate mutase family protein [Cohaesibacter sp. CAU 1516]TLP48410.1 phosphoglycerate mutase family protein [Cohaesibacter sp. CAU 1516]